VNSLQQRDTLGNFRTLGYRGVDREWNDDLQKARLQNPAFSIKVDSGIKTLLEAFITECKSKDITLIFVYTPEYIEGQRFVKNREEIINYYEALALKNDIPLLDYSAHAISSDRANFYNTSHLNKVGSSRFSEIFSDELVELLYQTE
jgi:hypothetical protein